MANTIKSSFSINTNSLKELARDLEETVPGTKRALTVSIKESAEIVATEARGLSSWSSRIPGSIRVLGSNQKVVVRAGGAKAPHAAPYENHGFPGTFRHPLFGDRDHWYPQAARPFLTPALANKSDELNRTVLANLDAAFHAAGF